MARLLTGNWRVADLRETLRLGLKGGGMSSTQALVLVERYAGPGNLMALKSLATNILGAALVGAPDEDDRAGEQMAGETMNPSPAES